MSEHQPDLRTWIAGVVFLGLAGFIGNKLPSFDTSNKAEPAIAKPDKPISSNAGENPKLAFSPPGDDEIPKNEFGDAVRLGERIFHDTQGNAREFVGNSLQCSNCHLDFGRLLDRGGGFCGTAGRSRSGGLAC